MPRRGWRRRSRGGFRTVILARDKKWEIAAQLLTVTPPQKKDRARSCGLSFAITGHPAPRARLIKKRRREMRRGRQPVKGNYELCPPYPNPQPLTRDGGSRRLSGAVARTQSKRSSGSQSSDCRERRGPREREFADPSDDRLAQFALRARNRPRVAPAQVQRATGLAPMPGEAGGATLDFSRIDLGDCPLYSPAAGKDVPQQILGLAVQQMAGIDRAVRADREILVTGRTTAAATPTAAPCRIGRRRSSEIDVDRLLRP